MFSLSITGHILRLFRPSRSSSAVALRIYIKIMDTTGWDHVLTACPPRAPGCSAPGASPLQGGQQVTDDTEILNPGDSAGPSVIVQGVGRLLIPVARVPPGKGRIRENRYDGTSEQQHLGSWRAISPASRKTPVSS